MQLPTQPESSASASSAKAAPEEHEPATASESPPEPSPQAPAAASQGSPSRFMVPIAAAVLGALIGGFAAIKLQKPPQEETRFLPFDKATKARLVSGFSDPEGDGADAYAWCRAKSCSMSLYMKDAADRHIAFHADPFWFPSGPPQSTQVFLNGVALAPSKKMEGPVVRVFAPLKTWHPGENEVRVEFGRADRPPDAKPDDQRPITAAFHWLVVTGP